MKMDPKTFEYNTAIQQITSQEQGEAGKLIGTLYGCWLLENYLSIWDWVGVLGALLIATLLIAGICFLAVGIGEY